MIFFAKGVSPWPKSPPQAEQKPVPQTTTPPARNSRIAVEEEYQIARQQGTAQALELFIQRHPDDPLAEKAHADLRRMSR